LSSTLVLRLLASSAISINVGRSYLRFFVGSTEDFVLVVPMLLSELNQINLHWLAKWNHLPARVFIRQGLIPQGKHLEVVRVTSIHHSMTSIGVTTRIVFPVRTENVPAVNTNPGPVAKQQMVKYEMFAHLRVVASFMAI